MIVTLKRRTPKPRELTFGQPYRVIGIEAGDYRLLDDSGKPYLHPSRLFKVIDARKPEEWVEERGEEGERYAYPEALNAPGFFEDFFDGKRPMIATFWRVLNEQLAGVGR
jgi:hypothetical protein